MSGAGKIIPFNIFTLGIGAPIYPLNGSLHNNSPDPGSGGIFGPIAQPALGFMLLGVSSINGGTVRPVTIAVIPPTVPAGVAGEFEDGIHLNAVGQWFRLRDINSQWFFGVGDTGQPGTVYLFGIIEDSCFFAGPTQ